MKRGWLVVAIAACVDHTSTRDQALTQQCPTTTVEGVDVFNGQGTIDWAKVAGSGRQFAFIKATQGNYNQQTTFAANWAGAKQNNVLRSPYHFFDGTIDGIAQANYFLAEIQANGGLQPTDLDPMLDIECPTSATQSQASANCEYTGNSGWVATATLKQRVFDFLTTVKQATGRDSIIYSYPYWFSDVAFTDAALAAYPLFIATYASCASVPAPWTQAAFWQYSASGTVPGISGAVDEDRFVGSAGDLQQYTAAVPDAGVSPGPDAGEPTHQAAGCGCRSTQPSLLALLLIAPLLRRRTC